MLNNMMLAALASLVGSAVDSFGTQLTVYEASESVNLTDEAVSPVVYATGQIVNCLMTPKKASDAFDAVGIVLKNPYQLEIRLADVSKFDVGYKVTDGIATYFVHIKPQVNAGGGSAIVLISETQYAG